MSSLDIGRDGQGDLNYFNENEQSNYDTDTFFDYVTGVETESFMLHCRFVSAPYTINSFELPGEFLE